MLSTILVALILVAVTVVVHAAGLVALLMALARGHALVRTGFWPKTRLLIEVTWVLVFVHAAEIAVWAMFFFMAGCLPDAESAFYFSGVTYATVGYGDVVLPQPWRMLGPIEGLTGILMCGLSTGLFFAIITCLIGPRLKAETH
jgi:Ion channel